MKTIFILLISFLAGFLFNPAIDSVQARACMFGGITGADKPPGETLTIRVGGAATKNGVVSGSITKAGGGMVGSYSIPVDANGDGQSTITAPSGDGTYTLIIPAMDASCTLVIPSNVFTVSAAAGGGGGGGGPGLSAIGSIGVALPDLGGLVANLLTVAYVVAAIFFLIQIAIGGITWINAGGDPKNLESARNRVTNAVIGLVIVVAAFAITLIITTLLGVNIFSGPIDIVP